MKRSRSYVEHVGGSSSSGSANALRADKHLRERGQEGRNGCGGLKEEGSGEEEDVPPSKTRSIKDLGRHKDGLDRNGHGHSSHGSARPHSHRSAAKRPRSEREDRGKVRYVSQLSGREAPAPALPGADDKAAMQAGQEVGGAREGSDKSEREEGELTPDGEADSGLPRTECRAEQAAEEVVGEGEEEEEEKKVENVEREEMKEEMVEKVGEEEKVEGEEKKEEERDAEGRRLDEHVVAGDGTGEGGEEREVEKEAEVEGEVREIGSGCEQQVKVEAVVMDTVQVDWKKTQETDRGREEEGGQAAGSGVRVVWTDLRPRVDVNVAEKEAEGAGERVALRVPDADAGLGSGKELTLAIGGLGREDLVKCKEERETTTENFLERAAQVNGDENGKIGERGRKSWERDGGVVKDLLLDMQRQKRPKLEVPPVSQSLPDTSLSLGSSDPGMAAGDQERSVHSLGATRTYSTGYTNSLSLSHSHPFMHNPSCSLTQNSMENQEVSCGSHQMSQGNEQASFGSWRLAEGKEAENSGFIVVSRRNKPRREMPLYMQMLQNGNPQILQGSLGNDKMREQASRGTDLDVEGSYQLPKVILPMQRHPIGGHFHASADKAGDSQDKSRVIRRDFSGREAWSAPARSGLPQETWSEQNRRLQEAAAGNGDQSGSKSLMSFERIGIHELVTEPIPVMARKLQVLPNSYLEGLKDSLREMLGSIERREEFVALQKILQRRTDLTMDVLLRSHPTQLELLVAVKTGNSAFVQPVAPKAVVTHSALVDIFLQAKCQNTTCQSQLPADDCECHICSAKTGFCNACMCVVCSKFDLDANTCRWIGCDFCLHWCHTDCGIRMGHIAPGAAEMQFKCIACQHTSELFGFVKEVFIACAKTWQKDVLSKELDCVRRMFHGSEDLKGKQLCRKAEQMLMQLESLGDHSEVCRSMLRFFTDGDPELGPSAFNVPPPLMGGLWNGGSPGRETVAEPTICDRTTGSANEALLRHNSASGEAVLRHNSGGDQSHTDSLEKARLALKNYDQELLEKRTEAAELQYQRAQQKAKIEELENIVRIKQTEAKMFQMRADEARKEAEGLHRIVLAKCEKVEEEYDCKFRKLRLREAEERRRKKFEETQLLDKAEHDFNLMKVRMIADIQDLLAKMENMKRQLF